MHREQREDLMFADPGRFLTADVGNEAGIARVSHFRFVAKLEVHEHAAVASNAAVRRVQRGQFGSV